MCSFTPNYDYTNPKKIICQIIFFIFMPILIETSLLKHIYTLSAALLRICRRLTNFPFKKFTFAAGKILFCRLSDVNFADGQRRTCRLQIFCLPSANETFAIGKCLAGRRQNSYRINGKYKFCHRQISCRQYADFFLSACGCGLAKRRKPPQRHAAVSEKKTFAFRRRVCYTWCTYTHHSARNTNTTGSA